MNKKIVINLINVVFLICSNNVNAEPQPIEQLKSFLAKTKSLTATFKQVTLNEKGQPTQTSHGIFYLSRPGKFRWNYKEPYVQEIVSSFGTVWFYDADLEQVTIKKVDKSLGSHLKATRY